MKIKNVWPVCCFLLAAVAVQAQVPQLWGIAYAGGTNNLGTIFKINGDGTGFSNPYVFNDTMWGTNHYGKLLLATNGKLYGLSAVGGALNYGVIFSVSAKGNDYSVIHSFDDTDLAFPAGSLIQLSDGKLYGTTTSGGHYTSGSIFSINLDGSGYTILYSFGMNPTEGTGPRGDLTEGKDGKLYGMATAGGAYGDGVVFSIDKTGLNYAALVNFTGNAGSFPGSSPYYSSLIQAGNGKFYGMTPFSGANNGGVIFSMNPDGSAYTAISFTNSSGPVLGSDPLGSLLQAKNGKLYGIVSGGGTGNGLIFSMDTTTGSPNYTVLVNFTGDTGKFLGNRPQGSLIQASDGKLYGTTSFYGTTSMGGSTGDGTIFSYDYADTGTFTSIKTFSDSEGIYLQGTLMEYLPPAPPTFAVNTPPSFCIGNGSATLTATCTANCDTLTYTWSPSVGLTVTTGASVTANPIITTTYTVAAINSAGGTATATCVVTVNNQPAAPVATAGTGATASQITANWNTEASATGYFLDVATDSTFNNFVSGYNNLNVGNVLTKNVTGLLPDTTYYYQVRATNDTCASPNSNFIAYATISIATGIQQYSVNQEVFALYPNPGNGQFTISLDGLGQTENAVRIEVINIMGQTIMTQLTAISNGHLNKLVNLPDGAGVGTYIVRLTAGTSVYITKIDVNK